MTSKYDLKLNVFYTGFVPIHVQDVGAMYECKDLTFLNPLSKGDLINYTMSDGEIVFLGKVSKIVHDRNSSVVFASIVAPEGKEIYTLDELLVKYMERTSSNFQQII